MWRGVAWFFVPWCVLLMTLQLALTHLLGWSNLIAWLVQSNSSFTSQVNCIQGNEPKCCLA